MGGAREWLQRAGRVLLLFLPMAAIGTLAHEAGHIAVARALGRTTRLHYDSMESFGPEDGAASDPASLRARERRLELVTLGGPASTILVGTLGLAWLVAQRRRAAPDAPPGASGWCATLLALFWSREVANPLLLLLGRALTGRWSEGGDEMVLARAWEVSPLLTVGLPALLGLAVCAGVVFRLHPPAGRWPLVGGGVAGSLLGLGLWYGLLGPWLLP